MKHFQLNSMQDGLRKVVYSSSVIPLLELKKFIADTFKPYKTEYQKHREWQQLYHGFALLSSTIGRVLKMLISILLPPLGLLLFKKSDQRKSEFFKNQVYQLVALPLWLPLDVIKGVLQVITAPFTVLIRKPLRHLITKVRGKPQLESNPGLRRAIKRFGEIIANQGSIAEGEHAKKIEKSYETIIYKLMRTDGHCVEKGGNLSRQNGTTLTYQGFRNAKGALNQEAGVWSHQQRHAFLASKLAEYDQTKVKAGPSGPSN